MATVGVKGLVLYSDVSSQYIDYLQLTDVLYKITITYKRRYIIVSK